MGGRQAGAAALAIAIVSLAAVSIMMNARRRKGQRPNRTVVVFLILLLGIANASLISHYVAAYGSYGSGKVDLAGAAVDPMS
jgi:hypothetical protein